MSSTPIVFGGRTFLSLPDVAMLIMNNMPANLYYIFHDDVSLLETISDTFVAQQDASGIVSGAKGGVHLRGRDKDGRIHLAYPTNSIQISEGRDEH